MGRENLLRGNWGEQHISERLSSCDCFVRHVPQGHDTGIDLYCETTSEDKQPFLHFWCQVKTSKTFKGKKSRITLNRQSKEMNVDYWLKQPIPVFIFRVPDLRDENIPKGGMIPFYIFNAIDFRNNQEKINFSIKIEDPEDLKTFLNEDLLIQTFRWDLMRGRVSHLLISEPSYTIRFPKGQCLDFEEKLQQAFRWGLRLLADDILDEKTFESVPRAKPYVKMLEVLASSIDDKHYETYELMGNYYQKAGDVKMALRNYKKSLGILDSDQDPEVSRQDIRWKEVFSRIEKAIKALEAGQKNQVVNGNPATSIFATMATGDTQRIRNEQGLADKGSA